MKTKFVYALVSSPADNYLEQAFVSMYSLKHHNPDAHIVVVTDEISNHSFVELRKKELRYADEIVVVPLDDSYTQRQRSRLIKTSIRQHVSGDYLFIDCDTVICKSLEIVDTLQYDIAACVDTHCHDFRDNPYRWLCLAHGRALDWPIEKEEQYFNCGVMLVKDTPNTHDFYNRWHANLIDGFSMNVFMDQPAFAKTNYQMRHIVHVLDDVWNCELKHGIRYLKDALIVHYLTTNTSPHAGTQLFLLNEPAAFNQVKQTASISPEIEALVDDPFKGLATPTHTFAGNDLYFFQTKPYRTIASSGYDYKKSLSSGYKEDDFLHSDLFYYLLRRYPKGAAGWLNRLYRFVSGIKQKAKRFFKKGSL